MRATEHNVERFIAGLSVCLSLFVWMICAVFVWLFFDDAYGNIRTIIIILNGIFVGGFKVN